MKKSLVILLLFILLSCVFCAVSCGTPADDGEALYEDIINRYKELLLAKAGNEVITAPDASADEIATVLYEIARDCEDPSVMGYATKDINGDGFVELLLMNKSNKLYALFTIQNSLPTMLLRMDHMSACITPDGTVFASSYAEGGNEICTHIKKIANGKLEGLEYGCDADGENVSYYKIENGVRSEITRSEMLQLDDMAQNISTIYPSHRTKTTGFRFVPALADASQSTAPVPDFTSYDGILSAYKMIVQSFSDYEANDWINGEFDDLFCISDNESYDVFHQIFWGGIRVMPTETYFGQDYAKDGDNSYGYARKDLNGDGIEELILLNDQYEVFALFTMKDGKAVLLDGAYGVWIDENGFLRKEVSTGGMVSRDGEAYIYEIEDAELKSNVGVGYKVNMFLQKEGWYKTDGNTKTDISDEEGEALYAEYDILPSDYCNDEYTRTFSGIEFVPLFEATLASQKHVNSFSNSWFGNGDTLTVSTYTDNDVTVRIKFVYTVGEFDPETNPDPKVYINSIEGKALRSGHQYIFEIDGIKGYIEFGVTSVWVIVTESENEQVPCKAYLFNRPENDW